MRRAYRACIRLPSVSFQSATFVGSYAFYGCTALAEINFPLARTAYYYCFYNCFSLERMSLPSLLYAYSSAFANCTALSVASLPALSYIYESAFAGCANLISLYLMGSSVCGLGYSLAFSGTPIGGYSGTAGRYGSIYVPASLYNSYRAANNWSYFASRFVSV